MALIAGALLAGVDGAKDDEKTRRAAMELYLNLCYDVCHGVLRRIANSLGARELVEIFDILEQKDPESVAIMLLNVAIQMEFTKKIPKNKISKLNSKLRSNPIAGLLLRQLVIQHLYLNEVRVGDNSGFRLSLGFQSVRNVGLRVTGQQRAESRVRIRKSSDQSSDSESVRCGASSRESLSGYGVSVSATPVRGYSDCIR